MPKSVLVIEDNLNNMYLMKFLLRNKGYRVIGAESGREGIELAKQYKPDIILLDIQLPEIDGYQVAEELRKDKQLQKTPIIAVTSYAMVGDREKAFAAGATGYIEKPIDPDNFITEIECIVSGKKKKELNDEDTNC